MNANAKRRIIARALEEVGNRVMHGYWHKGTNLRLGVPGYIFSCISVGPISMGLRRMDVYATTLFTQFAVLSHGLSFRPNSGPISLVLDLEKSDPSEASRLMVEYLESSGGLRWLEDVCDPRTFSAWLMAESRTKHGYPFNNYDVAVLEYLDDNKEAALRYCDAAIAGVPGPADSVYAPFIESVMPVIEAMREGKPIEEMLKPYVADNLKRWKLADMVWHEGLGPRTG